MKTLSADFYRSWKAVSWRTMLTGSFGSVLLHAVVLLIVSLSLRGCQKASSGVAGGEEFRDVGLFIVEGIEDGMADTGAAPGAGADTVTQPSPEQSTQPEKNQTSHVSDSEPVSDRLPSEAPEVSPLLHSSESESEGDGRLSSTLPPLLGPGDPIGGGKRSKSGGSGSLIQPKESGGAARIGGRGGPGETTFMDIAGVGRTFVYVIDTSSSMHGSRLKIAQSQLKASLRLLQPNQQFAVIFYNEYRERLKLRRQAEQPMYYATELNRQLASQEVDRITSDRGTEHKPALLEALSLKPDVIYFLTDGDEPELNAGDLREIAQMTGGTTIHVIKFGDGTVASRQTSWLERLARQAGGEFREIRAGN